MLLQERQRLRAQVEPGVDAEPFIFAVVAGPMPWNFPTGRFRRSPAPSSGVMTNSPSGLR